MTMSDKALSAFQDWLRDEDLPDEDQAYDDYRDWLDSLDGDVSVGSISWAASYVLENLDPIAFRCGFSDYTDAEELHEITIDGVLHYSKQSIDELEESFAAELKECAECGLWCLPEELETAEDDSFGESICPACRNS